MHGEASTKIENAPPATAHSISSILLSASLQAPVHASPGRKASVAKLSSAKMVHGDMRPTTPSSVKTAPLSAATLPPIGRDKIKCEEQIGNVVPRVGDEWTPVFISYQSAFTQGVLKIKHAMEARGIPCWMAVENMVGNVQDAIGEALMVAPAIIICFSHSYRDSMCKYNTYNNII